MTDNPPPPITLQSLDDGTRNLVCLSAVVAIGDEGSVRSALSEYAVPIPATWVEELLLQTYLFAGLPRALNAMREWRRLGPPAPLDDPFATLNNATDSATNLELWRTRGEATCALVYGKMYEPLRRNIRALHPALDEWMIVEGYGKVLSRPGLDLQRRELCIVAACAASGQDRQLHSHLHGAVNVGVARAVVGDAISALEAVVAPERLATARMLWARVGGR